MSIHVGDLYADQTNRAAVPAQANPQRLPSLQKLLMLEPEERVELLNHLAQALFRDFAEFAVAKRDRPACRRAKQNLHRRWNRLKHSAERVGHKPRVRVPTDLQTADPTERLSAEGEPTDAHQVLNNAASVHRSWDAGGLGLSRALSTVLDWREVVRLPAVAGYEKGRRRLTILNRSRSRS